jgi:hypothetical protein
VVHIDGMLQSCNIWVVGSNNSGEVHNNVTWSQKWGSWEHFYRMEKCVDDYVIEDKLL